MVARNLLPLALAFSLPLSLAALGCRPEGTSSTAGATSATSTTVNADIEPYVAGKALTADELHARKARLTAEQARVTQHEGTEPPFHNAYFDEHRDGIYVDVVSGEPLFSSAQKYDSHTGWPSFYAPLEPANVTTRTDTLLGEKRTEVRSSVADSHLGHVFDDGPPPTGLRYCMNSAALRFVPAERLTVEGYGQYAALFPKVKQVVAP